MPTSRHQTGTSLIEVLVALLILSIGLLGLAMLQGKSLRVNTDALIRSEATLLANEIIEAMRLNTTGAGKGKYVVSSKPAVCTTCTDTDGGLAANRDLIKWYEGQANVLPAPSSTITRDATTGVYTITMQWSERGVTKSQEWKVSI